MVAFQQHLVTLPEREMLGKKDVLAFIEAPEFDAARHALLNTDTHILNLVLPRGIKHVGEQFTFGIMADIIIGLYKKSPSGRFMLYFPADDSGIVVGTPSSIFSFVDQRIKVSRPPDFVLPVSEDAEENKRIQHAEAKLIGELLHDIRSCINSYHDSADNVKAVKPIRIEQKVPKILAEADCNA